MTFFVQVATILSTRILFFFIIQALQGAVIVDVSKNLILQFGEYVPNQSVNRIAYNEFA